MKAKVKGDFGVGKNIRDGFLSAFIYGLFNHKFSVKARFCQGCDVIAMLKCAAGNDDIVGNESLHASLNLLKALRVINIAPTDNRDIMAKPGKYIRMPLADGAVTYDKCLQDIRPDRISVLALSRSSIRPISSQYS